MNLFGLWRKACIIAAASATVILTGCAAVDTTASGVVGIQRKQYMSSFVPEQDLNLAAAQNYNETLAQAQAQGALSPNAAQVRRVREISTKLINQVSVFRPDASQWDWQVNVLKSDELNAWCMPGGKMAVYTGLIDRLKATDDELAAVMGHEIAHALREHSREQMSHKMGTSIGLAVLSAVVGSQAVGDLGGSLTDVMFHLPNSRTHEAEADLIGVELAARAGYDPRAAISFWEKMISMSGVNGNESDLLSTHPSPQSRIDELRVAAELVMPLYLETKKK